MKMEVLPVQNQFQGQFGVMGKSKMKDSTRPLTPTATNHHMKSSSPKTSSSISSATEKAINNEDTTAVTSNAVANDGKTRPNKLKVTEKQTPNNANNNDLTIVNPDASDESTAKNLSLRLQNELRQAKSKHLACTEVLIPSDLLNQISLKMIAMSEKEPCGIRGSIIYIEFEEEPNNPRRIASLQLDPNTVSTFELYLTLKQDRSGWTSILPQFLKNLTRSSTIVISPHFLVAKNKLYRSFYE